MQARHVVAALAIATTLAAACETSEQRAVRVEAGDATWSNGDLEAT